MNERLGDYSEDYETIRIRVNQMDKLRNPRMGIIKECVLFSGPRALKVAKYREFLDEHTGKVHHHDLKLETISRTKVRGYERKPENSIILTDGENSQIQNLFDFLRSEGQVNDAGEYFVVRDNGAGIEHLLQVFKRAGANRQLVNQMLSWIDADAEAISGLLEFSADKPERSQSLAAALNYGHYAKVLDQFVSMINDVTLPERSFQAFLEEHAWIFGSEYSELIRDRELIAKKQFDFPLRKTVDGCLEIIEIKTPITDPLFMGEHLSPRAALSQAIAQVEGYLELLDLETATIFKRFEITADKVRGKVIIGRDTNREQLNALRRHNINHNRIEVLTFDQLYRIGKQILTVLARKNPSLR